MKLNKLYIFTIFFIYLFASMVCFAKDFKVIVNLENETKEIASSALSDFFLKKKIYWNDDLEIVPVDQIVNSKVRDGFTKEVHDKSVAQIRAYWQQSVFSGKAVPPVEKNSDEDVIEFVKQHKGAIGYVSANANLTGVKEIPIVEE